MKRRKEGGMEECMEGRKEERESEKEKAAQNLKLSFTEAQLCDLN